MNEQKKIVRKLLYFAIGPLGGAFLGFITVPITTWLVSPEQFGLTTMFTLFQTFITSFIYIGMDQSFVREYNSYKGAKENLLFNAMLIPMSVAIVLMVAITIFMDPISQYLFAEKNTMIMIAVIIWIPFVVLERFLITNIRMKEQGLQYSAFSVFVKLTIMITTIVLLLNFEKTYTSIVLGTITGQIVGDIVLLIFSRELFKVKNFAFDKKLVNKMLGFGIPLLPAVVIMWVLNSTDRIILDYFGSIEDIGVYFSAMKLVSVLSIIQVIFSTMWMPIAYRWHETKVDTEKFTQINYLLFFVMGIIFISILLFKELAIWILSPEYSEAQYILPFLLFVPIMSIVGDATSMGISISRKTHLLIWTSLLATLVNIIVNLLLVQRLGGIGAAVGTGLAYITFFVLRTIISRRYWYNFNLSFYIINIFVLLVIASLNVVVQNNNIHIINFIAILVFTIVNSIYLVKIFKFEKLANKISSFRNLFC